MRSRSKISVMGLLLCLVSCLAWFFEKPTFAVLEIRVDQISPVDLRLTLVTSVENPNRFDVTITSLDCTLTFNDQEIGRGSLSEEVTLQAKAASTVSVPLTARLHQSAGLLKTFFSGRQGLYKIEGEARLKTPLGDRTFPFSRSGSTGVKK